MNDSDLSKQELLADILHTSLNNMKHEITVSNTSEKIKIIDSRQANQTANDDELITDGKLLKMKDGRLLIT